MYCPKCAHEIPDESRKCENCGFEFEIISKITAQTEHKATKKKKGVAAVIILSICLLAAIAALIYINLENYNNTKDVISTSDAEEFPPDEDDNEERKHKGDNKGNSDKDEEKAREDLTEMFNAISATGIIPEISESEDYTDDEYIDLVTFAYFYAKNNDMTDFEPDDNNYVLIPASEVNSILEKLFDISISEDDLSLDNGNDPYSKWNYEDDCFGGNVNYPAEEVYLTIITDIYKKSDDTYDIEFNLYAVENSNDLDISIYSDYTADEAEEEFELCFTGEAKAKEKKKAEYGYIITEYESAIINDD